MPSRRETFLIAALGALALVIQIAPLARFGPFFFGHDYGFYRRFLIEPVVSFPNTPVPGLDHTIFIPRIVLDFARFLVVNPDVALIGTYILFSLIGIFCLWRFSSSYAAGVAALYCVLLYVISGVQFESYAHFFFKEAIALPFFLLALLSFEKKSYVWGTLFGTMVVLSHQTSSIILIGILGLGFFYRAALERVVSIRYIFAGTAILATYLFLHPHVAQKISSPPVGIFISKPLYVLWSVPLIVLTIIGFRRFWPVVIKNPILASALTVTGTFFLFNLPFANRVYIFLDLFLVIPASFGVVVLFERLRRYGHTMQIAGTFVLFALAASPLFYNETTRRASLDEALSRAVVSLQNISARSIITTPALLPWVQGWSRTQVYAPGNLKEPHSLTEWAIYWSHSSPGFEREFLASFPQPLYVFVSSQDLQYRPQCSSEIQPYLFTTTCP